MMACMKNVIVVAGVALAMASVAWSQEKLPKGEEVLDKYVAALGGKEAQEKIKHRISAGAMEIGGLGVKGKLTMYQVAPDKMYMEADLPGAGKIEQGTDGNLVWEKSTVGGPRIKQGEERTSFLRSSRLDADANWRKHYKQAECKGVEKVENKDCYKVEVTTPEGQVRTQYHDKDTGLLVKMVSKEKTQFGEVPTEAIVSEYKKVDGVLIPHKVRQKVLTQEIIMTLEKVDHATAIPDDRFKLPEDVRKLADKEKDKKPAK
jgi:hypothetical protein